MFQLGGDFDDDDAVIQSVQPLPNEAVERSAFTCPEFAPDRFLSTRRHLGLERLKSELNSHLKSLKAELVDLINHDYQDFINLSTNLKGIDKSITQLKEPLTTIESRAENLRDRIQHTIDDLEKELEKRSAVKKKKIWVNLLQSIHDAIVKMENLLEINRDATDTKATAKSGSGSMALGKQIERVALQYNQMQHLIGRGRELSFAYVTENDWRINRIRDSLQHKLSSSLVSSLQQLKKDQKNAMAQRTVLQCLRTYALIDQTQTAELLIRTEFVRPFLKTVIRREDIQLARDLSSRTSPLISMYDRILTYCEEDLVPIRDIVYRDFKDTSYDILVNVLWAEIVERVHQDASIVYNAGQANVFHDNYVASVSFLSKLEHLCPSKASILLLRKHASYTEFMKRWQLPVYFQLRFHEIVDGLEQLLENDTLSTKVDDPRSSKSSNNGTPLHVILPGSKAVWKAISHCWSEQVFLYELAHQFWKLTLQILHRYHAWAESTMDLLESRRQQGSVSSPMSHQVTTLLASDMRRLAQRMRTMFEQDIVPKFPLSVQEDPSLRECMHTILKDLEALAVSSKGKPSESPARRT